MKSFKFTMIMKSGILAIGIASLTFQVAAGRAVGSTDPSDLIITHIIGDNDGYGYGVSDDATLPATEQSEGNWYFDNRTESELSDPYARFTDYELPDHPDAVLIHNIDISLFTQVDSAVYTVDISGLHSNRKCQMFVDDIQQLPFAELPSLSARGSGVFTFSVDPATISDGELRVEFRRLLDANEPKWGSDWALDYCALTIYGHGSTVAVPSLVSPENETLVVDPALSLTCSGNADYYSVQIARDFEFAELIEEGITSTATYTVKDSIEPGQYYWRVAGHSQWQVSDWSEIWSFSIVCPALSVEPRFLDFDYSQTGLAFTITNTGYGYLTYATDADSPWISVSAPGRSLERKASDTAAVTVDRSDLPPGDYFGQITVSSSYGKATIEIQMTVSTEPVLSVSPTYLNFGEESSELTFSIANIGSGTLEWSLASDQNWLGFSPPAGSQAELISVTVDRSEVMSGEYSGAITISSNAGDATVEVSMTVPESPEIPELQVDPIPLEFSTNIAQQLLLIKNVGTGTLNWIVSSDQNWIGLLPVQGSATNETDSILVSVYRDELESGVYTGLISVASNGGNINVPICMEIPPPQILQFSPSSLDFGKVQTMQGISIGNAGSGVLTWTVSADQTWVNLSPLEGAVADESEVVTVTVNREGLAPGNHSAIISIASNGGVGTITVAMEIEAIPSLSVAPLNLSFDRSQSELSLSISNNGGGELSWTAEADQGWIGLNPVAGSITTEADMVTVTVDRSAVNPGQHSGLITVSSDYGTAGISVDLVVNSQPEFVSGTQDGTVVEWATFQRTLTVTDADGDDLAITCTGKPASATFVDNGDATGLFSFTPDYQFVNQEVLISFEVTDGLSYTQAEFNLTVENFQLQVGQTGDDFDIMVHKQIEIPFNEPITESTLDANLILTSAHDGPLQYEYFGFGSTTPSLVIHPPAGELFIDLDTISVRIIGGPNGVLDLAGLPLENDYVESFVTGASVYPGDTDDNGVVDERDILPIGLSYHETGPAREITGIMWQIHMAHALTPDAIWSPPSSVYADADGNGMVNGDDICAVSDNWQKRVPITSGLKDYPSSDAGLALKQLEQSKLVEINQALAECPQSVGRETIKDLLEDALGRNDPVLPTSFDLHQNYPNPFNPETAIQFDLPVASHARLTVYNVTGQEVAVLYDRPADAGVHTAIWDGCDDNGNRVASGIYLYRLVTESESITRRMLLLK